MKNGELNIKYKILDLAELSSNERELIDRAADACKGSYSPYSHFVVGCALRLSDGSIVTGANQENIAYPSGLCAERTALFAAGCIPAEEGDNNKNVEIIAISAKDQNGKTATAYPCGACRQVMSEVQNQRTKHPIRVLIHKKDDTVLCFDSVDDLLPFSFVF
ncbi:MAG: cytidine deaminase [Bacteroidales bacterium]|nr:cytidine deaminase [Bacteroidales bacterium]